MAPISSVAHNGKVLLGAGVRSIGLRPLTTETAVAMPAGGPQIVAVPASVADAGKVRLGAGVRRA